MVLNTPTTGARLTHTSIPSKVTFTGAAALAELEEGSPPDFNCMNDHYGMSFVKGEAGEGMAEGTLTSDKVARKKWIQDLYTFLYTLVPCFFLRALRLCPALPGF